MSDTAPPSPRHGRTFGDLLRTVAVFAVLLGVIVFLYPPTQPQVYRVQVDYRTPVTVFAGQASFPVLLPVRTPAGWSPNHARTTTGASQQISVGFYVAARNAYVALRETTLARRLVVAALRPQDAGSRLAEAGRVFTLYRTAGGWALVTTSGAATVSVVTTGTPGLVEQLAALLRVVPVGGASPTAQPAVASPG